MADPLLRRYVNSTPTLDPWTHGPTTALIPETVARTHVPIYPSPLTSPAAWFQKILRIFVTVKLWSSFRLWL
jgi:hypothetical protein